MDMCQQQMDNIGILPAKNAGISDAVDIQQEDGLVFSLIQENPRHGFKFPAPDQNKKG